MDNIELFDKYISNSLTNKERDAFEARLKTDTAFKEDFLAYLAVVDGVCREAEQDDMDFGHALKSITKDQLRGIMGPRQQATKVRFMARPWVAWTVSMAAMVVIIFGVGWGFMRHADNRIMDNVYATHIDEIPTSFRGGEAGDITEMDDKQLRDYLPQLEKEYAESSVGDQDNMLSGLQLSMAYIRLHKKAKAKEILNRLADDYPDVAVGEWAKTILRQLE